MGKSAELPSEISTSERTVPGSSLTRSDFQTPVIHLGDSEARLEQERMVRPRNEELDTDGTSAEKSSSEDQFRTLLPDSQQQLDTLTSDLTTFSTSNGEESAQNKDERFKELLAEKPKSSIKTYSVTLEGDLVSEHSDSEKSKSPKTSRRSKEDLTTFSLSSIDDTQEISGTKDTQTLSSVSKDTTKSLPLSEYSYKSTIPSASDLSEHSEESQPKSSSLTNVTSDLSMTGASNLSQYTFETNNLTGAPNLTQYSLKTEDNSETPDLSQYSLKSADVTGKVEDKSANATEDGSNYLQQKFASLDNLISESKSLIARHKVLVDKNKQMEEVPPVEELPKSGRETTPGVQTLTTQESNVKSKYTVHVFSL